MKNNHLVVMFLLAGTFAASFVKAEDLELTFPNGGGSKTIPSALLDDTTGHLLAMAIINVIPKECCRPLTYEPEGKFYCCDSKGPYTLTVKDESLKAKLLAILNTASMVQYLKDDK